MSRTILRQHRSKFRDNLTYFRSNSKAIIVIFKYRRPLNFFSNVSVLIYKEQKLCINGKGQEPGTPEEPAPVPVITVAIVGAAVVLMWFTSERIQWDSQVSFTSMYKTCRQRRKAPAQMHPAVYF